MHRNTLVIILLVLCIIVINTGCSDNSTEPKKVGGTISGNVSNATSGQVLANHPAWIFYNDSLVATTDKNGNFSFSVKTNGAYQLICSSLNFLDASVSVQVSDGKTTSCNFSLTPDNRTGKIYGEFQDMNLFVEKAITKPEINNWNGKEIWEGVTGATLQSKTLLYQVPVRSVILGDSVLVPSDNFPSDDFGQYWMNLQQGTYYLKATCEGYKDSGQVVKILPDSTQYINFFLDRQ